jgi:hypothetical protein
MGTLLPWNFFITPYNFWMAKLYINYTEEGIEVNASNADEYVGLFLLLQGWIKLISAPNVQGFLVEYNGTSDHVD